MLLIQTDIYILLGGMEKKRKFFFNEFYFNKDREHI